MVKKQTATLINDAMQDLRKQRHEKCWRQKSPSNTLTIELEACRPTDEKKHQTRWIKFQEAELRSESDIPCLRIIIGLIWGTTSLTHVHLGRQLYFGKKKKEPEGKRGEALDSNLHFRNYDVVSYTYPENANNMVQNKGTIRQNFSFRKIPDGCSADY